MNRDLIPMPTKDELEASFKAGRCWWCGTAETATGSLIESWGQHFIQGHGLRLQDLRDILQVSKRTSFPMSDRLSARFSDNGHCQYDPDRLQNRGGPRQLSAFGLASQAQKNKGKKYPGRVKSPVEAARLRAMARVNGLARRLSRACAVCGRLFWVPKMAANGRRACSPGCSHEMRAAAGRLGRQRQRLTNAVTR